MLEAGNINEEDLEIFKLVDTPEDAVAHIEAYYKKYKLKPNF